MKRRMASYKPKGSLKMKARGLGGDIGRAIGDWIQSSLGLARGGKARKMKK